MGVETCAPQVNRGESLAETLSAGRMVCSYQSAPSEFPNLFLDAAYLGGNVMVSGERDREANSFGVEPSLPTSVPPGVGIPRFARNDIDYSEDINCSE